VGRKHLIPPARSLCQKELAKLLLLVLEQQAVPGIPEIRVLGVPALAAEALAVYFLAAVIWLEAHPEGMGVEQVVLAEKPVALEVALV
jgi:hypothetical protein